MEFYRLHWGVASVKVGSHDLPRVGDTIDYKGEEKKVTKVARKLNSEFWELVESEFTVYVD